MGSIPNKLVLILAVLAVPIGGCSDVQSQNAEPIDVPNEGKPGDYVKVILRVTTTQPCKLVLATPHETEIDNYLFPDANDTFTIPNSDGTVVFYEKIPPETPPGTYQLIVVQKRHRFDNKGTELYLQAFLIH